MALREIFAEFGIEFDRRNQLERGNRRVDQARRGLDRMSGSAGNLTRAIGGMAAAFSAGAIVQTFRSMVDATTESTNEINRWAQRLGISTREMASWHAVAQQFGGDMDDITDVLKELQLKARDAMTGTQSYIDAFGLLGITVDQLRPVVNDQNALFDLFTDALNRNTSAATRNFVVDELMSDAGTRLIPMFRAGTTEIRRLRAEADRMGGRQMPELVQATVEYTQAMRRLNRQWQQTRNALVLQVLPALSRMVTGLGDAIRWMQEAAESSHILEASLISVVVATTAILAVTAPVWGPYAAAVIAAVVATAALSLALDDVMVGLKGGKSATEEWGNEFGRTIGWARLGTDTLEGLSAVIKEITTRINQALDRMIELSSFFQTLTGSRFEITGISGDPRVQAAQRGLRAGRSLRRGAGWLTGLHTGRGIPELLGIDPATTGSNIANAPAYKPLYETAERGRTFVTMPAKGGTVNSRVSAPITNTFTITPAPDPEATGEAVQRRIDTSLQRQVRQLEAASVAAGGNTGSSS